MAEPKAATAKRKRSWPNVYTRVHGSGQASYVVDIGLINGKRVRHSFKSKTEVGTFDELKQTERQNQGTGVLPMPQAIKVDASGLILPHRRPSCSTMFHLVLTVLRVLGSGFQPRRHLLLENLALRHQLSVLQRSVPKPRLRIADRFLWVLPQQFWSGCHRLLVLVQPQTVVGWHRPGFRLFRRWKSRARSGRPSVDRQLIRLIRQMWSSNATGGASASKPSWPNWGSRSPLQPSASIASKATVAARPKPGRLSSTTMLRTSSPSASWSA